MHACFTIYPWKETKIYPLQESNLMKFSDSRPKPQMKVLLNDPWDNREASKPCSIRNMEPDPNTFRMNRGFPALSTHWESSLQTARCTPRAETQTKPRQYKFNKFLLIFVEKYNISNMPQNLKPKESTLTSCFLSLKIQQIPFLIIRLSSWAKNICKHLNVLVYCKGKTLYYLVKSVLYCGFNQIALLM